MSLFTAYLLFWAHLCDISLLSDRQILAWGFFFLWWSYLYQLFIVKILVISFRSFYCFFIVDVIIIQYFVWFLIIDWFSSNPIILCVSSHFDSLRLHVVWILTGDACCTSECKLRPGATCSDANHICCSSCEFDPQKVYSVSSCLGIVLTEVSDSFVSHGHGDKSFDESLYTKAYRALTFTQPF